MPKHKQQCCNKNGNCEISPDFNLARFTLKKELKKKFKGNDDIIKMIKASELTITNCASDLMLSSPVGNQDKYNDKCRADIMLSGYCTAPEAAFHYLNSILENEDRPETINAFNAGPTKRGVIELLEDLGFDNGKMIIEDAVSLKSQSGKRTLFPSFLLTQTLCCITRNGSAQASEVEDIIISKPCFDEQICASLRGWYIRAANLLKEGGIILLMGEETFSLLASAIVEGNLIRIDREHLAHLRVTRKKLSARRTRWRKKKDIEKVQEAYTEFDKFRENENSILNILSKNNKVHYVLHGAAWGRKKTVQYWKNENPFRNRVKKDIKCFPLSTSPHHDPR